MWRLLILLASVTNSAVVQEAVSDFPPRVAQARFDPASLVSARVPPGVTATEGSDGRWRLRLTLPPQTTRPTRVHLAGDFNGWNRDRTPMQPQADGSWVVEVNMEPGVRLYKFVLDGDRWIEDPANQDRLPDGQGGHNSVLRLGLEAAAATVPAAEGDGQIAAGFLRHEPTRLQDLQRRGVRWKVAYRTRAGDVEHVAFVARDGRRLDMLREGRLGPFDVWTVELPASSETLEYTFLIQDRDTVVRDPNIYSLKIPGPAGFTTPEWAKHAIWYQIMVDRFHNGSKANDGPNTRDWRQEWYSPSAWEGTDGQTFYNLFVFKRQCGGDLEGLRQKLPWLKELGVNALYLLPVFQADSNHKYNATSYIHIDERLGQGSDYAATEAKEDVADPTTWTFNASDRQFLAFLKEAKGMGFRVIIDGVFNHVGTHHPAFRDVREKGQASRFADWFSIKSWEPFDYEGWFGFGELPVFRKDDEHGIASEAARKHIFEVTRRWMDPDGDGDPSDGIDGWRLDVPNEVPMAFWHEWCAFVRKINPDAYITGEIWHRADPWLDGRAFDAVMNYEFCKPAIQWVLDRKNRITASELDRRLAELRLAYPAECTYVMQNLLDSHDTDRVASMARNPDREYNQKNREQEVLTYDASKPDAEHYRRVRLLALLQMTYVGAPMVWYGTEVGMWGSGDPNNRKPMLWKELEPYGDPEDNRVMDQQLDFYRRAIALRNAHPALRTGSFRTVLVDDQANVWVFLREGDGEQVLVALNASEQPATLELPAELGSGWKPVFGEVGAGVPDTAFPRIEIPMESGRVWARRLK
jgi:glycosidase